LAGVVLEDLERGGRLRGGHLGTDRGRSLHGDAPSRRASARQGDGLTEGHVALGFLHTF
jgi:hypothetical protein